MIALQILLAAGAVFMGVRTVAEWQAFRQGRSLLGPPQARLRVSLGLLVIGTIALILAGTLIPWHKPAPELAFWALCFLLTLVIAGLAWYDFKLVQLVGEQKLAELERERQRILGAQARLGVQKRFGARTPAPETPEDGHNGDRRRAGRSREERPRSQGPPTGPA